MSKLKIGVIISSTRDTRFADKPANWIVEKAKERPELDVEVLDLRDFNLPFFNEVASNAWVPTQDANAIAWQKKLAEFDGFIFVVAEYNRAITGALKNAIDQAYVEWNKKVGGIVAYGSMGGARAAENLRTIMVELQMVPTRSAVHVGGGEFMKVSPLGENADMSAIEGAIGASAKDMLDQLIWWGNAAKTARQNDLQQAAE